MKETAESRLAKYLGATALLGGLPAAGQILYTDVSPDEWAIKNDPNGVSIDLDQDGTDDFNIRLYSITTYGFTADAAQIRAVDSYGMSGVAAQYVITYTSTGGYSSGTFAASKFSAGAPIDGSKDFEAEVPLSAKIGPISPGFPWDGGAADGFLGLRLDVAGAMHYGWARIDLNSALDTVVLKDFALNLTATDPISTGQTISLVEDFERGFAVFRSQDGIEFQPKEGFRGCGYEVFELSGKSLAKGRFGAENERVELQSESVVLLKMQTEGLVWIRKL